MEIVLVIAVFGWLYKLACDYREYAAQGTTKRRGDR